MNLLTKLYRKTFKELLSPYGFSSSKKTFYRIKNDVLQILTLKISGLFDCAIYFDILPLSLGIEYLYEGSYDISMLCEKNTWRLQFDIIYIQKNNKIVEKIQYREENIQNIVNDMASIVMTKIVPIFEKGDNCQNALIELEQYEELIYGEKIFTPIKKGTFLTYIKSGNYKEAIQFLKKDINNEIFNHYERKYVIKNKKRDIIIEKAKYELLLSKDYEKTKEDIFQRFEKNLDIVEYFCGDIKKYFLDNNYYLNAKINGKLPKLETEILNNISSLEYEIEQLNNLNSAMSKKLKIKEIELSNSINENVTPKLKELELLENLNIEYFKKIISDNEEKSLEYLKNLNKKSL